MMELIQFRDLKIVVDSIWNPSLSNCIGCGCDDLHACYDEESDDACHWVCLDADAGLGICSACKDHIDRWDAGDREVAVPVEIGK